MPDTAPSRLDDADAPGVPPNWSLPAAVCASAIVLSALTPWTTVVAAGALGWTLVAFIRERRRWRGERAALRDQAVAVRREAARHDRLRAVLDAAGTPIIATDAQGVITVASRSAQALVGGGRSVVGRSFEELFTQPALHDMEQLARGGEPGRARIEMPVDGERRTLVVSADPLGITPGCVVTMRDVTELVRAGDLKADFAANASHELRTPIASIRGAAETLRGPAMNDPAMLERLTGIIATNAGRLEALVNDLLDLSKLESGDTPPTLAEVDMPALCAAHAEEFGGVCERRGLTIETDIEPGAERIVSDPVLVGLVLRNLVENATKFAKEGTRIEVSCVRASIPADPGNPPPPGATLPSGVRISVRDRGIGIPMAQQQRVFERFYQVDRARTGGVAQRGTGLGLAIVKHAARRLGGRAGIESVYQQGTTVFIELPRCAGDGLAGLDQSVSASA